MNSDTPSTPLAPQSDSLLRERKFWILLYLIPLQWGLGITALGWAIKEYYEDSGMFGNAELEMDGQLIFTLVLLGTALAIVLSQLLFSKRPLSLRLRFAIFLSVILPPICYGIAGVVGILAYAISVPSGLSSGLYIPTFLLSEELRSTSVGKLLVLCLNIMWLGLLLPLFQAHKLPKRLLQVCLFVACIAIPLSIGGCIHVGPPTMGF